MKRVAGELDAFLGRCVDEHRQRRKSTSDYNGHDFIDVLLSHFKEDEGANRAIKSGVTSMMTAGNDSTAAAMIRTIYLLLLHPNAMKKVQEELDHHEGKERTVNESDLKNLVYLQAVIKESLAPRPIQIIGKLQQSMVTAGYDSTASAMTRTIYLLLLHPNAMKKVQEELDHHVGKERTVNESDLKNLVPFTGCDQGKPTVEPAHPSPSPARVHRGFPCRWYHIS
ncbi:hypothetical protein EJ110_NYTH22376 [Nymphaea thermarum]|nr:hypothetical protein EJ110_NYTH22376 [Nymphaea thermarum]